MREELQRTAVVDVGARRLDGDARRSRQHVDFDGSFQRAAAQGDASRSRVPGVKDTVANCAERARLDVLGHGTGRRRVIGGVDGSNAQRNGRAGDGAHDGGLSDEPHGRSYRCGAVDEDAVGDRTFDAIGRTVDDSESRSPGRRTVIVEEPPPSNARPSVAPSARISAANSWRVTPTLTEG